MSRTRFLLAVAASVTAACSLLNAPDDVIGQGGAAGTATGSTVTGIGPECRTHEDCSARNEPCKRGVCSPDGTCAAENVAEGTTCGDAPVTDCRAADTCDAAGRCVSHLAPDGTRCDDCPGGPGTCASCVAGLCGDCSTRAAAKTFRTPLSTSGWALTGDFRVYESAAPNGMDPDVVFDHPVLGTDGNRRRPYPGHEKEESSATSPPTILPDTLTFRSWHVDEGTEYDKKTVSVSVDGGVSFQVVAVCPAVAPFPYPFCEEVSTRTADAWDTVTIDLAALDLAGELGQVRFSYRSDDACCDFERGWYLDALAVATDCACASATDCGFLDGTCATGTCDGDECALDPKNAGASCGDTSASVCSEPDVCSPAGLCDANDIGRDGDACDTCPGGPGLCLQCVASACQDCPALQVFDFPGSAQGWTLTGGWGTDACPPPIVDGEMVPCFPDFDVALGTDGARVPPYPGAEIETSSARSPASVIPQMLTFRSWHVDRGGKSGYDGKRIRISVDDGATFTTLVDCQTADLAFCEERTSRPADDWDMIAIDTGALAGTMGIVELTYDTLDTGASFSRGWYVDDINVARCDYIPY